MKRIPALILALFVGTACSEARAPGAGELRVVPLGGEVSVIQDGETSRLEEATTVDAGVSLLTGSTGRAQIQMPGGPSLELAPGASVRLGEQESQIERGSVLVRTGSTDLRLRAGGAEIEAADATFRVDRAASVTLGVYSGEAAVPGAGVVVPKLRQATFLQNGSLGELKPLVVDRDDSWDIRLLGSAIDLGLRLLNLERGLTRQLPRGDEVDAVSSVLEEDFPRESIRDAIAQLGDAARTVVAAVVAQEIERLDGGSRSRILREVAALHAQAANWIVIVAEWGLAEAAQQLLKQLGDLVVAIADLVAPPPSPPSEQTQTAAPPTNRTTTPGGDDPPGSRPPPSDPPDGRTRPQPPPEPPDNGEDGTQPAPTCSGTVDCAVEDIIDGPGVND